MKEKWRQYSSSSLTLPGIFLEFSSMERRAPSYPSSAEFCPFSPNPCSSKRLFQNPFLFFVLFSHRLMEWHCFCSSMTLEGRGLVGLLDVIFWWGVTHFIWIWFLGLFGFGDSRLKFIADRNGCDGFCSEFGIWSQRRFGLRGLQTDSLWFGLLKCNGHLWSEAHLIVGGQSKKQTIKLHNRETEKVSLVQPQGCRLDSCYFPKEVNVFFFLLPVSHVHFLLLKWTLEQNFADWCFSCIHFPLCFEHPFLIFELWNRSFLCNTLFCFIL